MEVEETTGTSQEKTRGKRIITLKRAIIAAGSQAVRLLFMPDDLRVAYTDPEVAWVGLTEDQAKAQGINVK